MNHHNETIKNAHSMGAKNRIKQNTQNKCGEPLESREGLGHALSNGELDQTRHKAIAFSRAEAVLKGLSLGSLPKGPLNAITDVKGVSVGHATLQSAQHQTGVTVIMPSQENIFKMRYTAASEVINGFGKSIGLVQIDELGQIESPIVLTNTLNVGKVSDALVDYMIEKCAKDDLALKSFNPVVCECNDSYLNAIELRAVNASHLRSAIDSASVCFEEGAVGAGRGMSCHQLKGGIGSSSRVLEIEGETYCLGVLVQANHGKLNDLIVDNQLVGPRLTSKLEEMRSTFGASTIEQPLEQESDKGSIIVIMATDLPLSDRQIKRVIRRATVGVSRVGGHIGHGSGEIAIGFSTANQIPEPSEYAFLTQRVLAESLMDLPFRAMIEATEEAVLHALFYAETVTGIEGHTRVALMDLWDSI